MNKVVNKDKISVSVRIPANLLEKVDEMVKGDMFWNRSHAFSEALKLLIRSSGGDLDE